MMRSWHCAVSFSHTAHSLQTRAPAIRRSSLWPRRCSAASTSMRECTCRRHCRRSCRAAPSSSSRARPDEGRNQEQSGAIRSNQEQSGAIRSNQKQSGAVRSNQKQSGAVRSSQKQSEAIRARAAEHDLGAALDARVAYSVMGAQEERTAVGRPVTDGAAQHASIEHGRRAVRGPGGHDEAEG